MPDDALVRAQMHVAIHQLLRGLSRRDSQRTLPSIREAIAHGRYADVPMEQRRKLN